MKALGEKSRQASIFMIQWKIKIKFGSKTRHGLWRAWNGVTDFDVVLMTNEMEIWEILATMEMEILMEMPINELVAISMSKNTN